MNVQYATVRLIDIWLVALKDDEGTGWIEVDTEEDARDLLAHWFEWMRGEHEQKDEGYET